MYGRLLFIFIFIFYIIIIIICLLDALLLWAVAHINAYTHQLPIHNHTNNHTNSAELSAVRQREAALRSLNPDDPRAGSLFHAALAQGGSGWKEHAPV